MHAFVNPEAYADPEGSPGFCGKVVAADFFLNDYGTDPATGQPRRAVGKRDTCARFKILKDDGEMVERSWKVCWEGFNVPSKDGKSPVDPNGEDLSGPFLVKSPTQRGDAPLGPLDPHGQWKHFLDELGKLVDVTAIDWGEDDAPNLQAFVGIDADFERVEQAPYTYTRNGKENTVTPKPNLCIVALHVGFDGQPVVSGGGSDSAASSGKDDAKLDAFEEFIVAQLADAVDAVGAITLAQEALNAERTDPALKDFAKVFDAGGKYAGWVGDEARPWTYVGGKLAMKVA